jgi:phosphate-selective porin OprO/OprP
VYRTILIATAAGLLTLLSPLASAQQWSSDVLDESEQESSIPGSNALESPHVVRRTPLLADHPPHISTPQPTGAVLASGYRPGEWVPTNDGAMGRFPIPPPASEQFPSDFQFQELARRLEAAEAEISALKARPEPGAGAGRLPAVDAVDGPFPDPPDPPAPTNPIAVLEQKWADFQKAANARTYPNVALHGVFQADFGWFHQDANSLATFGRIQDGADFRRARLQANGAVTENVNYFIQFDFAFPGRPTFTDLWMEMIDLPFLGAVRIGQWKEPFSLEVVSSFRYTTFAERSLLFQSFTPFRHIGMGFYNHADNLRATWAASAFRSGQDQFGGSISTDGGWSGAGRVTGLPWYDEAADGRYYLHLGSAYWFNSPPHHIHRFRTIPEYFIGENIPGDIGTSLQAVPGALNGTPFFVDTGPLLGVNHVQTFGGEVLWVHGPWSVQSEAMVALVNRRDQPNDMFSGMYAQVGYFLTGEHRPYDRKAGAIDRIIPFENFFWVRTPGGPCLGKGAWEVASRFSHVHLNDNDVVGGTLTDWTMGVNWYINPYCKIQANYIRAFLNHRRTGRSDTDIFGLRAQVDF